ncbi:hypothetical protein ACQP1W_17720 [Spirillospora sp. CA-255316]
MSADRADEVLVTAERIAATESAMAPRSTWGRTSPTPWEGRRNSPMMTFETDMLERVRAMSTSGVSDALDRLGIAVQALGIAVDGRAFFEVGGQPG